MAEITKQALKVDNNQSFPNNNNGAITPSILRAFNTNMIDSMVDEIGYNQDSASWNSSISQLNAFSASAQSLTTGSLLITASAVSNVITFTKGNGTTFNVTVADTTDLGPLNTFTASAQISLNNLNLFTSSYQPIITNLQASQSIDTTKFTTIGTQSGSWDNTSLNSYTASNDTKWNTLGSLSGSFVTESETGSFARTNTTNTFTQANTFTSISASSFVSASAFVGNGAQLTGITASIALPILDEGIPQGNAFSMNFTGSGISAIIVGGTAVVSVNTPDSASLNNLTASFNAYTSSTDAKFVAVGASTSSLNAFTASQQTINTNVSASQSIDTTKFNTIGTQSGSWVNVPLDSLNSFTQSQDTKNSTLATYTASVNISLSNINSFTASNGNTSLNSYTQSNDTKWSNLAGQTGSYVTSAITASSLVTASVNLNTITFTKGDASTFAITVNTGSGGGGTDITSLNSFTASQETKDTTLASVTSSLNTSASLALVTASFSGNTLTFTKGDASTFGVVIPDVSGSTINTGSFATTGSNVFVGNQTITGSLFISGNINMVNGADIVTHHVRAQGSNGLELQTAAGAIIVSMGGGGGTQAGFVGALSANSFSASTITGLGNVTDYSTSVDARLDSLEALTSSIVPLTSLNAFTSSQDTKNSTLATYTGSNDTKWNTLGGLTGSYATTGSNSFVGNQTITGSLILSSSNAVELQVIGNSVFTGSANGNVVALSITSNTASMNLNLGNYFTLTLADTATTHISASNVQPGVSATLVITTGTNSSASLAPTMLQPSGSSYSATAGSAKKDVLSIVAVASGVPFVVSTKNMI